MQWKKTRRLLKDYAQLWRDPKHLFGENVAVCLWPNGEPEIWIKSETADGFHGVRIRASRGAAGFGLTVSNFTLGAPISIGGNRAKTWQPFGTCAELDIVELCQYNADERSQDFKRAYRLGNLDAFYKRWPRDPETADADNLADIDADGETVEE